MLAAVAALLFQFSVLTPHNILADEKASQTRSGRRSSCTFGSRVSQKVLPLPERTKL